MKSDFKFRLTEDARDNFPDRLLVSLPGELKGLFGTDDLEFAYDPKEADIPLVYGSFVTTSDGIFSVSGKGPEVVSQGNPADAFAYALLLAFSQAVCVGSETLRSESSNLWSLKYVFETLPALSGEDMLQSKLVQFRAGLDREEDPHVFILTRSGTVNPSAKIFSGKRKNVYIVTTEKGSEKIKETFSSASSVSSIPDTIPFGVEDIDILGFLRYARKRGIAFLYHQGGRTALAPFVERGFLSELFLTEVDHMISENEKGNAQYLFSGSHGVPHGARLLARRSARGATLSNLDFRFVRSL